MQSEFKSRLRTVQFPDPKSFNKIHAIPETHVRHRGAHAVRRDAARATTARASAWRSSFGTLLFMLLPAINLVNLNISRILERASEIGVRKAFGASSLDPRRAVPGGEPAR